MSSRNWKQRLSDRLRYPRTITLPGPRGPLSFRVCNRTEEYRVAEYGGEEEFLRRFTAELAEGDCVFDIGASVGLMTLFAAAKVGMPEEAGSAAGRVVAFEPDPETRRRLEKNLRLNGLGGSTVIPWAVGESEEEAVLFSNGTDGFAPTLRAQVGREGAPTGRVSVSVRSLDAALAAGELPLPTVLKIDVEGAEILCLRGARRLLTGAFGAPPRRVFLEIHPLFLPSFGASAEEVRQLMGACGYRELWQLEREDQMHVCFLPRGKS